MKSMKGHRARLPDGIRIGQRFVLRFDDPKVEAGSYQGRLQELSRSGLLCFDAPTEDVHPPRGTPVTVRSIQPTGGRACTFSSEIRGRGRLRGHLPVLLVEPPAQLAKAPHGRSAHRLSVCLRGALSWRDAPRCPLQEAPAVVTNLSGGGAQVFLRKAPDAEYLQLTIDVPSGFIEETARRAVRADLSPRRTGSSPFDEACERARERFRGIRARVAACRLHSGDARGSVYAVSLAFCQTQETCFHLVRFLERQSLRGGDRGPLADPIGHAVAGRARTMAAAA